MTATVALEDAPTVSAAPKARRWTELGLTLGLGVIFLLGVRAAWFFTIDDAFITFRYSANLAAGHGPAWNVGEDPVEGFTNFAWMLWHAPFAFLGLELETVAKLTSVVFGLLTLFMLVRFAGRRAGLVGAAVAGGVFVLFLPTYFHITSGLETIAFAAVVLRAVIVGLRVLRGEPVHAWEPPMLLLLAGMLRPEGVVAVAPAFGLWLWHGRRRRDVRLWTAGALVAGLVYFGWRWWYFGQLFPNTFYVKFGNLDAGYVWLNNTIPLLVPLIFLTGALCVRRESRACGLLLFASVAAAYLTYVVSGPTMDYLHRFAYHAFPVLCLGAGLAVGAIGRRWIAAGVGALAVGWVAVQGVLIPDLPLMANYGPDLQRAHVAIGRGLAEAEVPAPARTLAVSDAGAIPYYSGWSAIDYIGLNDEKIAHGAANTEVVRAARPTVIVVTTYRPELRDVAYGLRVREATAGYQRVTSVRMRQRYWQQVFVLPEWSEQVRTALDRSVGAAQRTYDPGRYETTLDRWLDRLRAELM